MMFYHRQVLIVLPPVALASSRNLVQALAEPQRRTTRSLPNG